MASLHEIGAAEMARRIRAGTLSPVELLQACVARIEAVDPAVKAWVHLDREGAVRTAEQRALEARAGRWQGALHGVPVALKDIFDAAGLPTTAGAGPFAHRLPTVDATSVARLRAAGAVVLGKVTTTAFAFLDPSPTRNPWNPEHTPGGSSSGSAAAVGARMAPLALGSQTVGSVLRPAAYCGVVGFKPTHGRISAAGVVPLSSSLDHVGIFARTVEDCALALGLLAGADAADPLSSGAPLDDYHAAVGSVVAPRLGVLRQLVERATPELSNHIESIVGAFRSAGALVSDVTLPPSYAHIHEAGNRVSRAEAAAHHATLFAKHADEYPPGIRDAIHQGRTISAVDYLAAQETRRAFRREMAPIAVHYDALLSPTAPSTAPRDSAPQEIRTSARRGASPACQPSHCRAAWTERVSRSRFSSSAASSPRRVCWGRRGGARRPSRSPPPRPSEPAMTTGRLAADLLTTLGRASSPEAGFARAVRQLVALSGAGAGALRFTPTRGTAVISVAGARRGSTLDAWLRARVAEGGRGMRVCPVNDPPAGWRGRSPVLLSAALGEPGRPLGRFVLLGSGGRPGLRAFRVPGTLPRDLGLAMQQIWGLHQRTLRLSVINEITTLMARTPSLERIYRTVTEAVGRLIRFDGLGITLLDRERGELRVLDVAGRAALAEIHDRRIPMGNTLADWVAEHGTGRRVDDVDDPAVPPASRKLLSRRGFRSAILAPLLTEGVVIGTLNVTHRGPHAFTDADVEVLMEVARPLAFAIEQARLHAEVMHRAEELAALNRTSQLITARLDLGSLLDTISRSVAGLVGSTGCGIGLLTADRTTIEHVAAHGFLTPEWRALSVPVGEGIIGSAAASGKAVLSSDLRVDPRSIQRDVDEKEGIRSMLSVPLRVAAEVIGVISAFSATPNFFTARHQALLESFADQAGIAIQNARLFAESQKRARETQALYEAGRTVNQSLEVGETIRLILNQAREVLGVQSCGLFTLDRATGELASAASLDLEDAGGVIRIRVGEGITGLAVQERRPVQSADLFSDPRHVVRYRRLPAGSGLRSMLAAPLLVGDEAIGALTVLRSDVHHFTPEEESLVGAFADQAAMALEHARLFSSVRNYSEHLEAMVATRTQELDEQKRFVEVVLETLPLGLFLLDGELRVVSANRAGAALLPFAAGSARFPDLMSAGRAAAIRAFVEAALTAGDVRQVEEDVPSGSEPRTFRLTAAPLTAPGEERARALVLVEDITLRKRLEQQMLLTERLTTAGRMAAGVAHELNNPLATIAGCAEALKERARDSDLTDRQGFKDFPSYLSLIEEEAYRCKEITASLLHFVRDPGRRRTSTDLNALIEKVLELLSHQPRFAGSRLVTDLDPSLPPLIANEGHLRQVFLGLSANALEAMEGRGTLTARTRRLGPAEVLVIVEDEGPGIPEDILPRIFDPFFTTKLPGQGTGLGLAIAQGIVADHGGRIEVIPRTSRGAVFRVILPVSAAEEGSG